MRKNRGDTERRASLRLPPAAFSTPISVSLSSISDLALVNISRGGALLKSRQFLRPDTRIALKIAVADTVHHVMGRILRSNIVGLQGGLQYHFAVVFDREFTALRELGGDVEDKATTDAVEEMSFPSDKTAPSTNLPSAPPEDDIVYATEEVLVVPPTSMISDPSLLDALKLNRW